MSEINLLLFGCGVTFIAVGGAYIYIRERYLESEIPKRQENPGEEETVRIREAA